MKLKTINTLGQPRYDSQISYFVADDILIPADVAWTSGIAPEDLIFFEQAGPRQKLFFEPAKTRAAIVTCGGLCPGLNNVIRSVTRELIRGYGVQAVLGIRGGYRGLDPNRSQPSVELTEEIVEDIHREGGTMLGTSRGPVDTAIAVDFLVSQNINLLFTVGGDGTQRGGNALFEEARKRGHAIAVVGIPKTIDNDVQYVTRTFGYGTAVEEAVRIITCAHTEARSVDNGVAVVRLMGRHAGFIAVAAAAASQDVNFCLIPEAPFELGGDRGLLAALEQRVKNKNHAVVVVAEGAGQDLLGVSEEKDASGNAKLQDIGLFLKDQFNAHFQARGIDMTLRYFDPNYQIRGRPANTEDGLLCDRMGRHAVHAAMAGKTGLVISYLNGQFVHVPIDMIVSGGKRVNLEGELWRAVLSSTGQPASFS
jgi:6-phosphofructokinase 1